MKTSSRRGVPAKDDIPFRNKDKTPVGVSVVERHQYEGAEITIYQRDIGISGTRLAYTARVDNPETGASIYLGYHLHKDRLLSTAKQMVQSEQKPPKPKYVKMVSRQRAWELWYEGEDASAGKK